MGLDYLTVQKLAQLRYEELLQEAQQERRASQVARPGRPVRAHLADWLLALAARLDSQRIASAEA